MANLSPSLWYGICLTALLTFRSFLKLVILDPLTGFSTGSSLWGLLFGLLLAASCALLWTRTRSCRGESTLPLPVLSIPLGLGAILSALAVEFSVYQELITLLGRTGPIYFGDLLTCVSPVLGLLAGVLLLLLGVRFLRGRFLFENAPLLCTPVLWQVLLLVNRFSRFPTLRHISDQQLMIVYLTFGLFFWLSHGRWLSRTETGRGRREAVGWGYLTSLAGLSLCIPHLLALGTLGTEAFGSYTISGSDLILVLTGSLYAGLFAASLSRERRRRRAIRR